jgi:hypothetical protein
MAIEVVLTIFEKSEAPITFEGGDGVGATFVLGSAVPHPHQLHLDSHSVHTSAEARAAGERHIRELQQRLAATGDRRTGIAFDARVARMTALARRSEPREFADAMWELASAKR